MADGLNFDFNVQDKINGSIAGKLDAIAAGARKLAQATRSADSSMDRLRQAGSAESGRLKSISMPHAISGEIERLRAKQSAANRKEAAEDRLLAKQRIASGSQVAALLGTVANASTTAKTAHAKHAEELGGVGGAVDSVKGKFHEFFSFTGALLAFEALKKISHVVEGIGESILHAVVEQEHFTNALSFSVGNEGAKAFLEYQDQIIDHSLFLQQQTDKWGIELLRAGVPLKEIPKFLAAGEDVAAKSSDRVGTMASMMEAFVTAQRVGFIQGRALKNLGIGVDELKGLPQFAGKTAVQIRKALSKGKFTGHDVLGIIAAMGPDKGKLGDLAEIASKELGVKLMHLKERPELFFQNLLGTKGFAQMSDAVGGLLERLDPASPTGHRIFAALEGAFGAVADKISAIDLAELSDNVGSAVEIMIGLADATSKVAGVFLDIGRGLAVIGGAAAVPFTGGGRAAVSKMVGHAVFGEDETFTGRMGNALRNIGSAVTFGAIDSASKVAGQQAADAALDGGMSIDSSLPMTPPGANQSVGPVSMGNNFMFGGGIAISLPPGSPSEQAAAGAAEFEQQLLRALEGTGAERGSA